MSITNLLINIGDLFFYWLSWSGLPKNLTATGIFAEIYSLPTFHRLAVFHITNISRCFSDCTLPLFRAERFKADCHTAGICHFRDCLDGIVNLQSRISSSRLFMGEVIVQVEEGTIYLLRLLVTLLKGSLQKRRYFIK